MKTMGVRQAAESAADRPGAPPRLPAEALRPDRLIRARAIHSMTGETYRCVGLRGPEIVAVSAAPDGLDDLAGTRTAVADTGDLTVLPAFADSHEHLMEASQNTLLIPVDRARTIAEFTTMIAAAARHRARQDPVPGWPSCRGTGSTARPCSGSPPSRRRACRLHAAMTSRVRQPLTDSDHACGVA